MGLSFYSEHSAFVALGMSRYMTEVRRLSLPRSRTEAVYQGFRGLAESKALGNAVGTAFCDGACACLVLWGQQAKNSVAVCQRFCSRSKNTCKSVHGEDISFFMFMPQYREKSFVFLARQACILGVLVSGYDSHVTYHSGLNLRETIIYNKLFFYEYISLDIDGLLELCLARKIDG
ncbi:hypothetical protein NC652_025517 [Populus alba x Populus x berolinensis]|nr:hypothetical protein NC652_025517 [Populus alba x Populus x berolinensis]